jgi:hypothetical protein
MLAAQLNRIRERLDAVKGGRVLGPGLLRRARAIFGGDEGGTLELLHALDRDFDRAGIHTAADAKLLRELGKMKGRLGGLSEGLAGRAAQALLEFEAAVRRAERLLSSGALPAGLITALEADFVRLARAVKVADLFERPPAPTGDLGPFELFARPASSEKPPASARLAVAEFWAQRAASNVGDVAGKRRDLDLAHELLLRAHAIEKGDRDRLRRMRLDVAAARERVRASPVVRSLNDLIRHVRHTARRDPRTAYRSLKALYERAVEAGDGELARIARDAVGSMLPPLEQLKPLVEQTRLKQQLGWKEPGPTASGIEQLDPLPAGGTPGGDPADDVLAQLAFDLNEEKLEALELASGCARFFDVEDTLTEEIVEAELTQTRTVYRRVTHPTQTMTYEFTNSLDELHNFVVQSPSMLLYDLASSRQTVRAYLEEEPPPKSKRIKKTAVRVYVLDASGSMHGPRARFRDAILIAELNALRVKARQGVPFDPLYFSYFNDSPTELARVDNGAEATRQIEKLFGQSPAEGQTDISLALMSSFESIRSAQGRDPYLARATVVLVTDGEDAVDLELIRKTRRPFEGLDISLSFISLGEENPDLRSLVLEQRRVGGRAFYHHLADSEIGVARTEFDSTWRTLLPVDVLASGGALEALLPHLEALEQIAGGRPTTLPVRADGQFDALFPVPGGGSASEGPLAQRLADILDAVGEAASLASADTRGSESVTLLNHLLKLYEIALPGYLAAVETPSPALKVALERVRLLCKPFG